MKHLYILILLSIYSIVTTAQCAVTQSKGSHSTTYISKFEEAYRNKDLENGLISYNVSLVLHKDNDPKVRDYYMLECAYSTSGDYRYEREIVPRVLGLRMNAGELPLSLKAIKEEEISSDKNVIIRVYTYEINAEILEALKKKVVGILFVDGRKQDYIEAAPYPLLLSEQLKCLQANSLRQ